MHGVLGDIGNMDDIDIAEVIIGADTSVRPDADKERLDKVFKRWPINVLRTLACFDVVGQLPLKVKCISMCLQSIGPKPSDDDDGGAAQKVASLLNVIV